MLNSIENRFNPEGPVSVPVLPLNVALLVPPIVPLGSTLPAPQVAASAPVSRTLWEQTKVWVDHHVANLLPAVYLQDLKISQQDFNQWYHGNDDWQNQPEKSTATTVRLRHEIMWLDTRKYINLVREIDPLTYSTHLRMDKKDIDSWYTGEVPSDVTSTFLRKRCLELSINGIIWADTVRLVGILRLQYPTTCLRDLKTDQATLDAWTCGTNSTFQLTNEFRRNVVAATKRNRKMSAVAPPPS